MLGFRGASRYYDPRYRDGFLLECHAMRQVRQEMGLNNVHLMIPFCRTPDEGRRVLEVMAEAGLLRGAEGQKTKTAGSVAKKTAAKKSTGTAKKAATTAKKTTTTRKTTTKKTAKAAPATPETTPTPTPTETSTSAPSVP
jgi:hypothetical protein